MWVEIKDKCLISKKDLLVNHSVYIVVICQLTGAVLEKIEFTPLKKEEAELYHWPFLFAEKINKESAYIKAGEKNNTGSIEPLNSCYRNVIWKKTVDDIDVFTTNYQRDKWSDGGGVSSESPLPRGAFVKVVTKNIKTGYIYEVLEFSPGEELCKYSWPAELCSMVNDKSLFLKGGEPVSDVDIKPLSSSYRNHFYFPKGMPFYVDIIFGIDDSLNSEIDCTFKKIIDSIIFKPVAEELIEKWVSFFYQGKFNDIKYPRNGGDPRSLYEHFNRIMNILMFARNDAVKNKYLYGIALDALYFYVNLNFQSANWWDRVVGLAKAAATCLILISEEIYSFKLFKTADYLKKTANVNLGYSGGNQADMIYIQLLWAISSWRRSSDYQYICDIFSALDAISVLCLPVPRHGILNGEGLSVDYSFSQHNTQRKYSQLYAGSYGLVFLDNIFKFIGFLCGRLSLKDKSLWVIEKFIIDGIGWFFYKHFFDFQVLGRGMSRGMNSSSPVGEFCKSLLELNPQHPEVLKEIIKRTSGDESKNSYYSGSRAYWVNDYLCSFNKYFSIRSKVISTRTVGSESGNGENLKGYYLGCGSYYILRTGNEYYNIQPLLDWQKIPGTTVEQISGFKFPLIEWGTNSNGSHDFSGVVCDHDFGLISMVLTRRNVKNAKKTLITFKNSVILIGSSIDTSETTGKTVTTVNQCIKNGDIIIVYTNGVEEVFTAGERSHSDIKEVRHDGLRYTFNDNSNGIITVCAKTQSGSWSQINRGKSTEVVKNDILTLYITHKKGQDQRYLYRVSPVECGSNDDEGTIVNTSTSHLFISKDKKNAIGSFFVRNDSYVSLQWVGFKFTTPIAFIALNSSSDHFEVTIADLTQKMERTEIVIKWGEKLYSEFVSFPVGDYRGQPVKLSFNRPTV
ncbi:polysaccharide lyase family 8 super-sandwich domain-containing protein [Salmonella enterica subsp. enterica]